VKPRDALAPRSNARPRDAERIAREGCAGADLVTRAGGDGTASGGSASSARTRGYAEAARRRSAPAAIWRGTPTGGLDDAITRTCAARRDGSTLAARISSRAGREITTYFINIASVFARTQFRTRHHDLWWARVVLLGTARDRALVARSRDDPPRRRDRTTIAALPRREWPLLAAACTSRPPRASRRLLRPRRVSFSRQGGRTPVALVPLLTAVAMSGCECRTRVPVEVGRTPILARDRRNPGAHRRGFEQPATGALVERHRRVSGISRRPRARADVSRAARFVRTTRGRWRCLPRAALIPAPPQWTRHITAARRI
jgi:hypothetical protein